MIFFFLKREQRKRNCLDPKQSLLTLAQIHTQKPIHEILLLSSKEKTSSTLTFSMAQSRGKEKPVQCLLLLFFSSPCSGGFFFFFLFLGNQSSYSDLSFYPLDKCPSRLRYTLKIVTIVCNQRKRGIEKVGRGRREKGVIKLPFSHVRQPLTS